MVLSTGGLCATCLLLPVVRSEGRKTGTAAPVMVVLALGFLSLLVVLGCSSIRLYVECSMGGKDA